MIELYNGDCYEFIKKIPDNSIDLVVTDPPYLLETQGAGFFGKKSDEYSMKYKGKKAYTWGGERYVMKEIDSMKNGFSELLLDEICRVMKKINCYFFCSQKQIPLLLDYFLKKKGCNWNILTWHKTNPIPACGNKYLTDTEFILFFREKGVKILGNFDSKFTYYVTPSNMEDKRKFGHPTIKPLNIVKNLIINSSQENDLIYDPFMGSGTTGVACKELGRNFIGCEIDKNYFEIAKKRIDSVNEQSELIKKEDVIKNNFVIQGELF